MNYIFIIQMMKCELLEFGTVEYHECETKEAQRLRCFFHLNDTLPFLSVTFFLDPLFITSLC